MYKKSEFCCRINLLNKNKQDNTLDIQGKGKISSWFARWNNKPFRKEEKTCCSPQCLELLRRNRQHDQHPTSRLWGANQRGGRWVFLVGAKRKSLLRDGFFNYNWGMVAFYQRHLEKRVQSGWWWLLRISKVAQYRSECVDHGWLLMPSSKLLKPQLRQNVLWQHLKEENTLHFGNCPLFIKVIVT